MQEDVTVREVMRREFVGVSESDPLREAAELLLEEDGGPAVVLRGGSAVGTFRTADALDRAVSGAALDGTVSEAMSPPLPAVAPDLRLSAAASELADAGAEGLLVVEGDEVVGVVTATDLVNATVALAGPPADESSVSRVRWDTEAPVEQVTASAEGQSGGPVPEASHGVCETCGALSADLRRVEGQRRCPDCREA